MNVLMFPPTHGSGLGAQFRETSAALAAQGVEITLASEKSAACTPDIVHLFDAPDIFSCLASFLAARALGKPIVVNPIYWNADRFYSEGLPQANPPQGDGARLEQELRDALRNAERAVQRAVFRRAAVLIAMSAGEANLLANDFEIDRERICIATDGINPIFANATADAFVKQYGMRDFVLCAARIEIRKNQWALVRALRDEDVTLVFAGETLAPPYRELCERAAQGGRARVIFLPSLDAEMLASAYAAARVHALASWYDCAPFTPLEAAVAHCSIAMSTESGARDYFKDEAHYFDPADLDVIRRAVRAALDTPSSPAVRERLLRDCTWARCAEQTREAYARAQELNNPQDDGTYRTDLEQALGALGRYGRLQEQARAELWREKMEIAGARDAYANGRVMRLLNRLQGRN